MKTFKVIILILLAVIFASCGGNTPQENYDEAISLLAEQKYDEAVVIFEEIANQNTDKEIAPKALFETAKLYQGKVIKNLSGNESLLKSVELYKKVYTDYPSSKEAENSLFMAGFILANELNDLNSAKETYELFIQKFPEGSLVDDAKVELENLGKTPEEILMDKIKTDTSDEKKSDVKEILKPSLIAKLKTLEIKARTVVEGFMVGYHKSPYHGFSVEFSQHRPYMQGDSIKNLDWKVFAKSERYYIKQYEEETNLLAHIILDSSKSMDYKNEGDITKFEYSKILAASFAYLLLKQQDAVGLAIYSDTLKSYLRPKSKRTYLRQILTELENLQPNGTTETSQSINSIVENIRTRGLVIIISDFLDDANDVLTALKKFYYKKNEVIIFHILDPIEKSFGFGKDYIFVDVETAEELKTQPIQIQQSYREAMKLYLQTLKNGCEKYGFDYNLIDTKSSFDSALMSFFKKRSKLK